MPANPGNPRRQSLGGMPRWLRKTQLKLSAALSESPRT